MEMVDDDFLTSLEVGCFVSLYFSNYEKEPVIGKVISIEDNYFEVHYWKGTYLGKWSPQHVPRRRVQPWVERLPKPKMKSEAAFFTLVMLLAVVSLNCNANRTELFIPSLLRTNHSVNSIELGIQLAIEAAENSSDFRDFLNKYKINVPSYYTKGKVTNAIYTSSYVLRYREGGYALLLLGPQTSSEASGVLKVVRFYRKFMVTCLTTTSEMMEKVDPYGITFAPTAYTFNKAIVKIMNHFKWKRAALVYDYLEKGGLYLKVRFAVVVTQNMC